MKTPQDRWRVFLHQCLVRRIDVLEFKDLSDLLASRSPIPESTLATILVHQSTHPKWDPLLPLYIDCLHRTGRLKTATVLRSLLKRSSILQLQADEKAQSSSPSQGQDGKRDGAKKGTSSDASTTIMTDIKVIQDVILSISTGQCDAPAKAASDAVDIFMAVSDWILAVVAWHNNSTVVGHDDDGDEQNHVAGALLTGSPDAILLFESLGILLAVLYGSSEGVEALSGTHDEGMIRIFRTGLFCLDPYNLCT